MARWGRPERSKVSTASPAVHTTGSPWRLNEVLSTAPTPVRRSNSRMTAWYSGFHDCSRICGRAVPSWGWMAAARASRACGLGRHGEHHVRRGEALGIHEVLVGPLGQDRRRERHPEVAVLDHPVDERHHAVIRRIGEDGAVAEGARAELHPPRAAGHHAVGHQEVGDARLDPLVIGDGVPVVELALADHRLGVFVGHARPQIRGAERGGRRRHPAAPALLQVPQVGRAHRVRLVPARREGEEVLHPLLARDQHVRLDVHEDAAAEREPRRPVALAHQPDPAQEQILEEPLGAARDGVEAQAERGAQQELVAVAGLAPAKARGLPLLEIEDARAAPPPPAPRAWLPA